MERQPTLGLVPWGQHDSLGEPHKDHVLPGETDPKRRLSWAGPPNSGSDMPQAGQGLCLCCLRQYLRSNDIAFSAHFVLAWTTVRKKGPLDRSQTSQKNCPANSRWAMNHFHQFPYLLAESQAHSPNCNLLLWP